MSLSFDDAVNRIASQSDAVGRLAQDSGAFAAVVAAFESKDSSAFRWVLDRLEMLPYCELICEWVRVKLCVLRCVEICGPPRVDVDLPNLEQFARAVARLASNEPVLRRVVDAVSCGNREDYASALREADLIPFCHLLCYWVCSVGYRRVCEVICRPIPIPVTVGDAVAEIRATGKLLSSMLENKQASAAILKAAASPDCEILKSAIDQAGFANGCEIICRLICTRRCVEVCRTVCGYFEPPILRGVYGVEEARAFALAFPRLAAQPRALADLVGAVAAGNKEAYSSILERFNLLPFCHQVCAWICSVTCHEYCTCVCPPGPFAWFTSIGALLYETQVDSSLPATGLTDGATQAFFSTLRLNGALVQTLGGQPLEYTFEYQTIKGGLTTLTAAVTAADTTLHVASSASFPASGPFNAVLGKANGGYEIITVTGVAGNTWTVLRAQQGTIADTAVAGATIVTGVASSSGWTQVPQAWIPRTVIGLQEIPRPFPLPPEFVPIAVNPIGGDIPAPFTVDGWIQVPQGGDIFLNGTQINLDTTLLPSFPVADETGVVANGPANHPLPVDQYYGLRMLVRQHGSATSSLAGTCSVVAIDNTLYKNVNHHPEWDGGIPAKPEYAVVMIDIKELQAAGCATLKQSLTVLFTASHPNLGSASIEIIGPGGPYPLTLPTPLPETGDWYGSISFPLAGLKPCAYIVRLSVDLLLTTGDSSIGGPLIDEIAFCLK